MQTFLKALGLPYEFKKLAEIAWFVGVAAIVFVAEAVVIADFEEVATDPEAYVVALLGGAGRIAIVTLLNLLSR